MLRSTASIDEACRRIAAYDAGELRGAGLIPGGGLYYPTIYYPPVPMHGPADEAAILSGLRYDGSRPSCLYLHIPFCRARCLYCHWMVNVDSPEGEIDEYLDGLVAEAALWKEKFGVPRIRPRSVLLGGGTPTVLSPRQIARLFRGLEPAVDLAGCTQITCETEPGSLLDDAGPEKLRVLKDHGVGRVSLGVQAFDDRSLADMGRRHSAADVAKAVDRIGTAGFASLSVDLIYGYPGCTPQTWLSTLQTAVSLGVNAFQLYRLRIVPHGDRVGTIASRFDASPEAFPSVDDIYVMKQLGSLVAEGAGLSETSRRLFARPGHGSHYLRDHTDGLYDVIGLGASSWSNVQGRFYLNTGRSLAAYCGMVRRGTLPIDRGKVRTPDDERRWAVALTLKHNGVPKERFLALTGETVAEAFPRQIEALRKYGLVEEDADTLRLTPRGVFFADEVVTRFYHPRYLPFPRSAYAGGDLNPYGDDPS